MKKQNTLAMLLSVAFMLTGAITLTMFVTPENLALNADNEYTIKLDATTNNIKDIICTTEDMESFGYAGDYLTYPITTSDGHQGIDLFVESCFSHPGYYVCLGLDGGFGNLYKKDDPYHGRINGLKKIIVNYEGGNLNIAYGYEQDMAYENYRVTSQPLTSGVEYLFDNNYPQYFNVTTELSTATLIKDVTIVYSCNQDKENLPATPYYDSGYHVGVLDENKGDDVSFKKRVHSNAEAYVAIEEAVVRHYRYADITFDYDNIETLQEFLDPRRDFSHTIIYSVDGYSTNKGAVNRFEILYGGDTLMNNDLVDNYPQAQERGKGIVNHFHVASMYTNPTPENTFASFENGNNKIREDYHKKEDILRDPNFNNFAIEKLDDSCYMDVYNSEDLWWSALHNFKPRFPLENSKAEWIYNEAKKILNQIIYPDMNNYEKIRAIYEWIVCNTQYDYDALNTGRYYFENVCFFLEGVFERRLAVCDGFSKTFVLLAKMEGLDVRRGVGFSTSSGHAWAYARFSPDEPYYLICPTWGDNKIDAGTNESPNIMTYISYDAYLTKGTYFVDKAGNQDFNFHDLLNENVELATNIYSPGIFNFDVIPQNPNYDYCIDNTDELLYIVNLASTICTKSFTLSFTLYNNNLAKDILNTVRASDIDKNLFMYAWTDSALYGVTEYTLLFVEK